MFTSAAERMPRMNKPLHPGAALFKGEKPFPIIPSCEHYAGSEKLMLRALALQDSIGPVFDLTPDCLNILVSGAGDLLSHITLPKATSARQVAEAITCIQRVAAQQRIKREIPVNAIIETHGTLRYVWEIAAMPWMQSARVRTDGLRVRPPRHARRRLHLSRRRQ